MVLALLLVLASAQPETREQVCTGIIRQSTYSPASFKAILATTNKNRVVLTFEANNLFGARFRSHAICVFSDLKSMEAPLFVYIDGMELQEVDHLYELHLQEKRQKR